MSFSFKNLLSSVTGGVSVGGSSRAVGVDFGSSAIKVVELALEQGTPQLKTYGELQLGPYADAPVGDVVQVTKERQKEALVDVFRESYVETRDGTFAIPLLASFVTPITVTAAKEDALDARVRVEARKYIPVPMSDVSLDWADISSDEVAADTHEILLVAIQNKVMLEYKSLMEATEMLSQPTEIECFSAIRALDDPTEEYSLIIDVGALTTKLYITYEGNLHRMHRVRTGGQIVTTRLSKLFGVTFAEAESMKRTLGYQEIDSDTHSTVASAFERAFSEFRRVVEQYKTRTGASFSRVVLTGGSARLPTVRDLCADVLECDVVFAEPFANTGTPAFMEDTLKTIGPNFTVATGAALRTLY